MRPLRLIHKLVGGLVIVTALSFGWGIYQNARSQRLTERIAAAQNKVVEKLSAYYGTNGHYPESLQVLTFTNSPEEIKMLPDVRKMTYGRTKSGYAISYQSGDL